MLLREFSVRWFDSRYWWERPDAESVRYDLRRQCTRILRGADSIEHLSVQFFARFCILCCSHGHRLGITFNVVNVWHHFELIHSSAHTDRTNHSAKGRRLCLPGLLHRQRHLQSLDRSRQPRRRESEHHRKVRGRLYRFYLLWGRILIRMLLRQHHRWGINNCCWKHGGCHWLQHGLQR